MSEALFSPSWYRVANLRPRLKPHANIHRHEYQGDLWYVLQDRTTERFFRFTPDTYYLIGLMDGQRTVDEIWTAAVKHLSDHAPTQNETIRVLGQLHAADVLQCDISPDASEVFSRHRKQEWLKWRQRISQPLAVRIPLFDPDKLLVALLPYVKPLLSWVGFTLWLLIVISGAVLAVQHWTDLTENVADRVLAPDNLLLIWLLYPLVKILHELGHGIAARHWGAEVHEVGIMLLVLIPVPYVEASSASAFAEKERRIFVDAAGIMVEVLLASLAMILWINLEPGLMRSLAFNVMLIGGVSTLLFNGNPLLRFDGYYVLADTIEVPNLATRSRRYLLYLIQRYVFGMRDANSPVFNAKERPWLLFYGIASLCYRLFIMGVIILFIAGELFFIGVLLAIWAAFSLLVLPLIKGARYVMFNPQLRMQRGRAMISTTLILSILAALLFLAPFPLWTKAQGVVWLPDKALVLAGVDGSVSRLLATPNSPVRKGTPLIALESELLQAQRDLLLARERELSVKLAAIEYTDQVFANVVRQELASVRADLVSVQDELAALVVKSPTNGVFVVPRAADLPGHFVRKGSLMAYVIDPDSIRVRAVVSQDDIGLVRGRTHRVDVRRRDPMAKPLPGVVVREVPAGTFQLPAVALGATGGGRFPVDPMEPSGLKTLERVFEIELEVPGHDWAREIGARVNVRFDHGFEPVGLQLYRIVRQLFLSKFNV